jgi:acyl-CoA synthetase (NDP forming)
VTSAQAVLEPAAALPCVGPINEVEAKRILGEAGIPVVREIVVCSAEDAAISAAEIGFPVVMKVVSPQILHKTEVGGVRLGISSVDEASRAYQEIVASAASHVPDAEIEGVLVAPMVSDGVETIMGVQNDPTFGPTVMFGLGGVFVEVLQDVTYRLAPFDVATADLMVREIKGFDLLDGARGAEPCDIDALARALSALSEFAVRHAGTVESIDLNPVLVRPRGKGVVALDALIVRKEVDDLP